MSQTHALPIPFHRARPAAPADAMPSWRRVLAWLGLPREPRLSVHEMGDRTIQDLGLHRDAFARRPVWTGYDFDRRS